MAKSIIFYDMSCCCVCGNPYAEEHHVFEGTANRRISEKYHLTIPLCAEHHRGTKGIHSNKEMALHFKRKAQAIYEAQIGTREQFIKEFGKNYL